MRCKRRWIFVPLIFLCETCVKTEVRRSFDVVNGGLDRFGGGWLFDPVKIPKKMERRNSCWGKTNEVEEVWAVREAWFLGKALFKLLRHCEAMTKPIIRVKLNLLSLSSLESTEAALNIKVSNQT